MKASQIKILYKIEDVNEWLLINRHLEIISVSLDNLDLNRKYFLIHYKIKISEEVVK